MKGTKDLKKTINLGHQIYFQGLSVDCVIFGFHNFQLKVLVLKKNNLTQRALPGGFIYKNENVDDAATRILQERTGLDHIFLQQFRVFGDPRRSKKPSHILGIMKAEGIKVDKKNWLLQRFVTVGYYALVEYSHVTPICNHLSETFEWCDIHTLPPLIIDHREIFQKALETLRIQLNYQPVGYNLLPEKFTMPELQKLYETILDKKLDRRNFQRKMLGFGILNKLKEQRKGVAHKAPFLYTFNLKKYHKALREGWYGGW